MCIFFLFTNDAELTSHPLPSPPLPFPIWISSIFPFCVACLFTLSVICFNEQRFLNLMKFKLLIVFFMTGILCPVCEIFAYLSIMNIISYVIFSKLSSLEHPNWNVLLCMVWGENFFSI